MALTQQENNTCAVEDSVALPVAVENSNLETQTSAQEFAPYNLKTVRDYFRNCGLGSNGILPQSTIIASTVTTSGFKFGDDMQHVFGDFLIAHVSNITDYYKMNTKTNTNPDANKDAEFYTLKSYDKETVSFKDPELLGKPKGKNEDGEDEDDFVTMSNDDFLELVKSRGFKNAVWETRAVVHCRYLNSERHNKVKDFIDEDSILAVYLAPTSLRELEGYLMKFQMGIGDPNKNQVKFTVTEVKAKGYNFMKLAFSTAKDSELEFDDK